MLKKIANILSSLIIGVLIIMMVVVLYVNISAKVNNEIMPSIGSYSFLTVLSGSMEPEIKAGDVIVINKDTSEIKKGDVITFSSSSNKEESVFITHRAVEQIEEDGNVYFKTQGDSNNVADEKLVSHKSIVGKYSFKIPYMGYLVVFVQKPWGFASLVAFPILLLILIEVRELIQMKKDKKREQLKVRAVKS